MSVTFDLTGASPDSGSMVFIYDGLQLTISTGLFDTDNNYQIYENTPILNQDATGIGMLNPYGDAETGIDGDGKQEVAILSFSQVVKITSITFTPVPTRFNETAEGVAFRVFGDGLAAAAADTAVDADNSNDTAIYGSLLGIGAVTRMDGFRIASITVEFPLADTEADAATLSHSLSTVSMAVLDNDIDAKSILSVDTTGLLGSVAISADGQSVVYTNSSAFSGLNAGQTATENFTYTVLGWDGTIQVETVTLTVRGTGGQNFVTGTSGANTLNGTALGDTINGLSGNDILYGGDGDDLVLGGAGRDTLDGQAGADDMLGGTGNDTYYTDDVGDTVVESADSGTDSVYSSVSLTLNDNVEKLYLTGSADLAGTGNASANTLVGNAGANRLEGGDGGDSLDGGLGADTMIGGLGNDNYTIDDVGDVLVELDDGGTDKVNTVIDHVLGEQFENLTLLGSNAIDGAGNDLKNTLTGNGAANILSGFAGNDKLYGNLGDDTLAGGTGRDTLTGGGDADTFLFGESGSADWDTVVDFVVGTDLIGLEATAFGLPAGTLAAEAFAYGTGATDALQRIIYDQFTGNIWYDADGSGAGAKQQIASLTDGLALTIDDFIIL